MVTQSIIWRFSTDLWYFRFFPALSSKIYRASVTNFARIVGERRDNHLHRTIAYKYMVLVKNLRNSKISFVIC